MRGKKGMSPLIATILLMAFAVALGAVIMNWSSKLPEDGAACETVKVQIQNFCLDGSKLNINLRNVGDVELASVALRITDEGINIPQLRIEDSRLGDGQTLKTSIPYGFGTGATVGIVPSLQEGGETVACKEPVHTFDNIEQC